MESSAEPTEATAGRDQRRWRDLDIMYHRLIEPGNGRPAATRIASGSLGDLVQAALAVPVLFAWSW